MPNLTYQPSCIQTCGCACKRVCTKVSNTLVICHRSQAMELHCSVGRRARVASSRLATVASTISQFRSRALNIPSTAAMRTSPLCKSHPGHSAGDHTEPVVSCPHGQYDGERPAERLLGDGGTTMNRFA